MAIGNGVGGINTNANPVAALQRGPLMSQGGSAQITPEMIQALAATLAMELSAAGLMGAQQLGQNFQQFLQAGPPPVGGPGGGGGAPAGPQGSNGPNVVVIDDFQRSHGQEISQQIASGGVHTSNLDIGGQGDRAGKIASALDSVIQQVQSGTKVDAVNLSQQDFTKTQSTQAVQAKIAQLQQMGVPVVVAAGNEGKGAKNELAGTAAYVVGNGTASSGVGNVQAQGSGTSQAAANVSIQVAKQHFQQGH